MPGATAELLALEFTTELSLAGGVLLVTIEVVESDPVCVETDGADAGCAEKTTSFEGKLSNFEAL